MDEELIQEIITYIEEKEECVDGEFGSARSLEKLISDNDMPELYWKLKNLLK